MEPPRERHHKDRIRELHNVFRTAFHHPTNPIKNLMVGAALYGVTIMLLKTAILLQWIRVLNPEGLRDRFFWVCQALIWFHIAFYTACTLVEIWACKPRKRIWDKSVEGRCVNIMAVNIVSSAINSASDLVIFVLPQRIIWKLHMPRRKKMGIFALFAVGLV